MSGDVLATIVAATTRAVEVRATADARRELERVAAAWQPRGAALLAALAAPGGVRIIAECKRRSPSRGILRADYDPAAIARQYAAAGATAISVLTEPTFFDGALDHLRAVRAAVPTPILRKDFFVDEFQILEAHAAGADAILLIVAALDDATLARLHDEARALGLTVLVEVHDEDEIARALAIGAELVGVNARNLRTLEVDRDTFGRLGGLLPDDVVRVAESGIGGPDDAARYAAEGADVVLVGEALVKDGDPAAAVAAMRAAATRGGRESR